MSTGSIGSAISTLATLQQQATASAAPQVRRETENDGDKDDKVLAPANPAPSVNLNGQVVGRTINTTA
ncbi:hypothetical protein [uncultured Propionivibrio sp.]|uniref:hypothetical protein n=1 Tax=uncultured Propionivibrio sp. TaxID=426737 RepID=UPI0029BFBDB5|nr:hypothetical protein [uncultured Propionivibrio sp.]